MANMSYCRFENTYRDLLDCQSHLFDDGLSETEKTYRKKLIEICNDIVDDIDDYDDDYDD